MRLVILILLLTLPSLAFAAPAVIAAIGVFLVTYGAYIVMIAMAIYGASQQREAERKAAADWYAGLKDRSISGVASDMPYMYVYGRARVGGSIVGLFTSGSRDQYKNIVIVHAAHECDAIEEIYIGGRAIGMATLTVDGYVGIGTTFHTDETGYAQEEPPTPTTHTWELEHLAITTGTWIPVGCTNLGSPLENIAPTYIPVSMVGNVATVTEDVLFISYRYVSGTPYVRVFPHLGTPTDPADAFLLSEVPGKWFSTSTLRGFCYTVIQLNLFRPEFQQGLPPIEALIRGKKLYDPRTGLTTWSQNPALVAYDYLTSEMCGVDATDIPVADYITAANVCDATNATDASIPVSLGARYTFNGTIAATQQQAASLEYVAQSMAGHIVSTTWSLNAGKYIAPVLALYQEDIIGQFGITPGVSDASLYNGVRGQYISAENDYVATDFKPYQSAVYVTEDGVDKWSDLSFPFSDSTQRVHNLARIFTEDQRAGYTFKAEFNLKTWPLKVGERITMTSETFGWAAKVFRVTDKKFSPTSAVELTLKEDAASIWDFADDVTPSPILETNFPDPFDIALVASLTVTSGDDDLFIQSDGTVISRMRVTWPLHTTQSVLTGGLIEVQWKLVGGPDVWQSNTASGSDTEVFLSPIFDGGMYVIRARAVNPYLNVKSPWTFAANHTALGKLTPPNNVMSFSSQLESFGVKLHWGAVDNADLKEYEIRVGGIDWNTSSPVVNIKATVVTIPAISSGSTVFRIKALDTSGNYSVNELTTVVVVAVPQIVNPSAVVSGEDAVISWSPVVGDFAIDHYEVRSGASWAAGTVLDLPYTATYTEKINYGGTKNYWVAAVDIAGNVGVTSGTSITITAPSATTITTQVIDNNILLYWTDATMTLPIASYEIRRGAVYASAEIIGTKQGLFTALFETVAGTFTYWVTGIDSAGNYGTPANVPAAVNQPPDYVLQANNISTFSGTLSNALLENGTVVMPVDLTETWATHFSSRGWASPDDQIAAGYPIYIQPALSPGYYEEVVDLGAVLGSNKVTLAYNGLVVSGAPTVTKTISLSADNISYTDYPGVTEVYAAGFRYIKIRITSTGGLGDLYSITALNIRVDSKLLNDADNLSVVSTDAGGTTATFNVPFLDVTSINVTPWSTTASYAIVDFTATAYPTTFKILLYNSAGTRVSGTVSWTARGH